MNPNELEKRLEVLEKFLRRQGGQAFIPGRPEYKIQDLVQAVEQVRKSTGKVNTISREKQEYEYSLEHWFR